MDNFNRDDQFKKLTIEEKNKVVGDLVLNPEDILCKSTSDLFVIRPQAFKLPNLLQIRFTQKDLTVLNGEELICQFLLKKENLYIFKCHYTKDTNVPCIALDNDFYMIQRRENYRLKFPIGQPSKVTITTKGELFTGRIFDLSTTGIRVVSYKNTRTIKMGDEIDMEIQVPGHEAMTLKSHLRHRNDGSEVINDRKLDLFFYGFEFHNLSLNNVTSLSRINMELYRAFFQKLGTS
jgi:c-di-GMP-binding flagellar brake protein YcgR